MGEPEWKVEKQPSWLVTAIRRTIVDLPRGYEEAAEILGVYRQDDVTPSTDALHNRLRTNGDQIFPLGWALVLQQAAGVNYVTQAIARRSGMEVFIPPEADIGRGDIGDALASTVSGLGSLAGAYHESKEDDVITPEEFAYIEGFSMKLHSDIESFVARIRTVYGISERDVVSIVNHRKRKTAVGDRAGELPEDKKGDARECAAPGVVADKSLCMEKSA